MWSYDGYMSGGILTYALSGVLIAALVSLASALYKTLWIYRQPAGNENIKRISGYVANGAMTFLGREYRVLELNPNFQARCP